MQRNVGKWKRIVSLCLVQVLVLYSFSHFVLANVGDNAQAVQETSGSERIDEAEKESLSSQESEEQTKDEDGPTTSSLSESTKDSESTDESPEASNDGSHESEGSGAAGESESKEEQKVVYDTQPTTLQEVQNAIDTYNAAYEEAMESGGWDAAALVSKNHWKSVVAEELMPSGYSCQLVDYDNDFGADYYTFFSQAASTSSLWDGSIATSIGGIGTQ